MDEKELDGEAIGEGHWGKEQCVERCGVLKLSAQGRDGSSEVRSRGGEADKVQT